MRVVDRTKFFRRNSKETSGDQTPLKPYRIRIIGLLLLHCSRRRIFVYQRKTLPSYSRGYLVRWRGTKTTRARLGLRGREERRGRKITFAARRDGNAGAKIAKLRGIFKYCGAPSRKVYRRLSSFSLRRRQVATFDTMDGTCRSKLPRFNQSSRSRSGVKSLTKESEITTSQKMEKTTEHREIFFLSK